MGSVPNCQKEIPVHHAIRWLSVNLNHLKIKGFGGPQGQGVGVVMLFHINELQLGLYEYMKMKLSLSIFSTSVNVHPRW